MQETINKKSQKHALKKEKEERKIVARNLKIQTRMKNIRDKSWFHGKK